MDENHVLSEIWKYKYTGNCYYETYRGGDRVYVAKPGSADDKEAQAYCKSSSRWTFIGEFVNGIEVKPVVSVYEDEKLSGRHNYVIQLKNGSEEEELFWSNDDGWVSRESATVFTEDEHNEFMCPGGGFWLEVDE